MPITLDGTKGVTFPSWTTATRPASPVAGQTGFNTTTGQLESYDGSAWEIYTAASTQGTSGQYLKSNGSGTAPSWASVGGGLIRAPQVLTSGTSYTTPSNCTAIYVEMIGGGGAGGSAAATGGRGGGGGGGIWASKYVTVSGNTSYTIAVGAGGTPAAAGNNNGGNGGSTSITIGLTTYTAGGGGGGGGAASGGIGSAGTAGSATNMDQSITPVAASAGTAGGSSGAGGSPLTPYGSFIVGAAVQSAGAGTSGSVYGTGGSGGYASAGTSFAGGAGTQGYIRIWEYT